MDNLGIRMVERLKALRENLARLSIIGKQSMGALSKQKGTLTEAIEKKYLRWKFKGSEIDSLTRNSHRM